MPCKTRVQWPFSVLFLIFCLFYPLKVIQGNPKAGLAKGGLARKAPIGAKKGPFGTISALPPWVWGTEELVPIGPEKAPTGPEKAPISPEKARFPRKDFPPIFSENLGLKPPFFTRNSLKMSFFPGHFESTKSLKNYEK